MDIRRLDDADVPAAAQVAYAALPAPPGFEEQDRTPWLEKRTAYLAGRDPGGAWVAVEDGEVVGMTNAIVRDGIWGLSMLAVRPDRHARGAGRRLLEAALTHAEGTRGQLIMSSQDPKAMRLYARAGFDLLPGVSLSGTVDRTKLPSGLRARPTEDLDAAAQLAAPVRGGAYDARDLELLHGRPDSRVLAIAGHGFVMHENGRLNMLVADSREAGADLLWSALAEAPPGASADIDPIVAGQDWAIQAGLEAGLPLTPTGPMFARGRLGPLQAWIPSGTIL